MNTSALQRRRFLLSSAAVALGCATTPRVAPDRAPARRDEPSRQPEGVVDLTMGYGPDTLRLDRNESPFGPSPRVVEAVTAAMTQANRYVNPTELIERLAARHRVDPRMIQLGTGSNEILHGLPLAFMRDGGNVVTATESYRQVADTATRLGREVRWVPLRADFTYDVPAMLAAVDANTRLFVIVSPNNPTGTTIAREELLEIAATIPPSTVLVVDEAYVEFLPEGESSAVELVGEIPNLVVVRTFSKAYGLAGLRLGYAVAQREIVEDLNPAIATWPNIAAYAGCAAALEDAEHVRRYTEHAARCRAFYRERFSELGLPFQIGYAPVAMLKLGTDRVERVVADLSRHGILVRAGRLWGMHDWIRISFGLDDANERVIEHLRALV